MKKVIIEDLKFFGFLILMILLFSFAVYFIYKPDDKAIIPIKTEVRVLKTDLNKIRNYMDSIQNDTVIYDSIYFYIKFKKK